MADQYYKKTGYKDYDSHLRAIDFDQPVEVIELKKGDKLYQYSYIDRVTGKPKVGSYYYSNKNIDPEKLGFPIEGRKMVEIEIDQSSSFLQSKAANIEDWNGSGKIFEGGETQLFNPNLVKSNINIVN